MATSLESGVFPRCSQLASSLTLRRAATLPAVLLEDIVRTYAAAIVGALVATLGLAAWQTRTAAPALTGLSHAQGQAWTGSSTGATPALYAAGMAAAAAAVPTVVRCAPGQRAIVRQTLVDGQPATATECAWDAAEGPSYREGRQVAASDIVEYPRAVPARYVVTEPAPRRVAARRVAERPKRSWKKTALVIGGSAGAGAGIGALTGGKKGALIGAAIGGGAASIYEAVKRR